MPEIKHEVRRLHSRYLDGTPIYPGEHLFTWIRPSPTMPWMLAGIEIWHNPSEQAVVVR